MRIWNTIFHVAESMFVEVAFTLFANLVTIGNARFAKQREWEKQTKKQLKK